MKLGQEVGVGNLLNRNAWIGPLLVALVLLPIYLATNSDGRPQSRDTLASAIPAWRIATYGDLDITEYVDPYFTATSPDGSRSQDWYVATESRATSNRPPGAIFWAVPFYWVTGTAIEPMSLWPATVAASTAVALGMAFLTAVFQNIVSRPAAAVAGLLGGLGTPFWGIASDALWQHTVSVVWLALGLVFMARRSYVGAGLSAGLAMFTRPLVGIVAFGWGTLEGWYRRSISPVVKIGLASTVGFILLLWYYQLAYGSMSLTGGYGSYPVDGIVSTETSSYLVNILNAFASADRGIFMYTPFLVVLVPGLVSAWRVAPSWIRASSVSAIAYLLIQLRVNNYTGGQIGISYRLPLEALVAVSPLLVLSYREWVVGRQLRAVLFWGAVGGSVVVQLVSALWRVS